MPVAANAVNSILIVRTMIHQSLWIEVVAEAKQQPTSGQEKRLPPKVYTTTASFRPWSPISTKRRGRNVQE